MPYKIEHTSPKCWSVINTDTKKVHSRCTTEAKAKSQMRLLYGVESGWKPTGKKTNSWIQLVKQVAKEKGISYREALKVAKETYKK